MATDFGTGVAYLIFPFIKSLRTVLAASSILAYPPALNAAFFFASISSICYALLY